ncbi:MAG: polysaccharide biosynthesis C-terminal domain-containing protein, partial [Selenomonadales bacterium]|nr:polysaccharide biosynthesis C-terminal domain-containing protein [Selenomonadales bacterium]
MDLIKDNVNKLFYQFLLPSVSSAVAVAAYSLIDTIAIGHGVGANGVAACALVLPIFSIAGFIALLCGIGGSVLMNRSRGEGDHRKGDAYFTAAILLAVILTFAAWAAGNLWQDRFYQLCGADDILLPYARAYGEWIFAFLPSFAATTFLACFVRSDGSPRFVLFAVLTGGVINIIGDWLFVFPLQMGMAGAAIATVLGSVVQASMLLGHVLARKTSLRTARPRGIATAFRQIFFTGFGAGIGSLA